MKPEYTHIRFTFIAEEWIMDPPGSLSFEFVDLVGKSL